MKTIIIINLFLALSILLSFSGISEGAYSQITKRELLREENTLKNKLGNMDIYVEPCSEGFLHIFRDIKEDKEFIVKIIYDIKGNIIVKDKYSYSQGRLFWEHKDNVSHFIIIFQKDGTKTREDFRVSPTPSPTVTFCPAIISTPPYKTPTPQILPTPISPSALKEKIIFSSDLNGNMDIYTMNIDGTNLHRITKGTYSEVFPSLSSDGTKIVYSSNESGYWNIYTIDSGGNNKIRITDSKTNDIMPSFIDNNIIIFQSFRNKNPQIYKISVDVKRALTQLTYGFNLAIHPALYPNKNKIVFTGEKDGFTDMYSIDVNGNGLKQLTHSGFEKSFPSVSPDGKTIAFCGNLDGRWEIYTVDPVRGIQKRIKTGFIESFYPSFTSDGRYIVFQSLYKGKIGLYKINLSDENNIIKLTDNKADNIQARCQFIMVQ
ncbi:MAG TPA: DUF5050 domain-containing protein [Candidatus Eremiobacteraeota bacterium]|nr:MAG: translocation protein TolB [bacterium ADurb.Bin363]HPZ09564.1 DUF5050 domain-containing protein [Candidatus Eremiobacteraeota bacterium]